MSKLNWKHKTVLVTTALLWTIWIIFTVYFRDIIKSDVKKQIEFGVLMSLAAVLYGCFCIPIKYPDINLITDKIHDNNREIYYETKRLMFCLLQLIYVFFLGGTSISLYYETWRIGIGVVVTIFIACFIAVTVAYYYEYKKILAIPAPTQEIVTEKDN